MSEELYRRKTGRSAEFSDDSPDAFLVISGWDHWERDEQAERHTQIGAAVEKALSAIAGDYPALWLETEMARLKRRAGNTGLGMMLAAIADALEKEAKNE